MDDEAVSSDYETLSGGKKSFQAFLIRTQIKSFDVAGRAIDCTNHSIIYPNDCAQA